MEKLKLNIESDSQYIWEKNAIRRITFKRHATRKSTERNQNRDMRRFELCQRNNIDVKFV